VSRCVSVCVCRSASVSVVCVCVEQRQRQGCTCSKIALGLCMQSEGAMPRRSLLGIMGVSILLGSEQRAVAKDTAKNAAKPVFVEEVSFPASLPSSCPASLHPSAFSLPPSISFTLCLLFSRSLGFHIDLAPSLLSLLARSLARLLACTHNHIMQLSSASHPASIG
jgi:hypothetical protein